MEQINLNGNVLLRHGFQFHAVCYYTLDLPGTNGEFTLYWDRHGGLMLCLKYDWECIKIDDLQDPYLHDLRYLTTLEMLKEVHLALTEQPLVELAEDDEVYQQHLSYRTTYYNGRFKDDPGINEYTEKFEPIELIGFSFIELTSEVLKAEGFAYRNRRYELRLFTIPRDFGETVDCTDLIWEEDKGLYLESYKSSLCVCTISLAHIRTLGALQNLKTLLTPRLSLEDMEWEKRIDKTLRDQLISVLSTFTSHMRNAKF